MNSGRPRPNQSPAEKLPSSGITSQYSNEPSVHRVEQSGEHEKSLGSQFQSSIDMRRGFMGSQSRMFGTRGAAVSINSQNGLNSDSIISSEEDSGSLAYIWGTNLEIKEIESKVRKFLLCYSEDSKKLKPGEKEPAIREARGLYLTKIRNLLAIESDCLNVDSHHIYDYDQSLYNQLIYHPSEIIMYFDKCSTSILRDLKSVEQVEDNDNEGRRAAWGADGSIQTRITNLKQKSRMRDLGPRDINQLVSITGIIVRSSEILPDMRDAFFKCVRCSYSVQTPLDKGRVMEPGACPKCGSRGSFDIVHNNCYFTDKQLVSMQERPEHVPEGETPHNISLIVYEDLVDQARPGDRVEVTGIFRAQATRRFRGKRIINSVFKTYLDVVSLTANSQAKVQEDGQRDQDVSPFTDDEVQKFHELANNPRLYDLLISALCPSIWENQDVKKGLLCQLFGGTQKEFAKNMREKFRSDINILLVGDPSTAKSQLLTTVHKLAPRGIYTSGKGSSAVGLTAYVSKDPETRETILESGALVLSDRGICCIDEFDKMDESTKVVLHEAMEQQTVSLAKHGVVCSLPARSAVLAAANPRDSKYNARKSIVYNLRLPPTLLSRFDLIYLLLDRPNEEEDRKLAFHILSLYAAHDPTNTIPSPEKPPLSQSFLSRYISFARKYKKPQLKEDSARELVSRYLGMRQLGANKNVVTATPRQLESLIRISEALSKMRLSEYVERRDVEEADRLVKTAIHQAAMDPVSGQIDMDLISTGFSAGNRSRVANLAQTLKEMMATKDMYRRSHVRYGTLAKDFRTLEDGKYEMLSDYEIVEALKYLADCNDIFFSGNKSRIQSVEHCTIKLINAQSN